MGRGGGPARRRDALGSALGPPGSLWVGTSQGLALFRVASQHAVVWPTPPLPAGRAARALLAGDDWLILGGDEGLSAVGELPRGWETLLMVPGPVIALAQDGPWLYVITQDGVWRAGRRDPPEALESAR
jgi:ligand-binding sensor domain-containing protein